MFDIEEAQTLSNGEKISLLTSKILLKNPRGETIGILGSFLDMTERKRLEQQLAQAQKLESIGQLAAGVAHEINTPLQFLSDNIEYLGECSDKLFSVVDGYEQMLDKSDVARSWQERYTQMQEMTTQKKFVRIRQQMPAAIEESREGVQRAVKIVNAMKDFSHPGTKK